MATINSELGRKRGPISQSLSTRLSLVHGLVTPAFWMRFWLSELEAAFLVIADGQNEWSRATGYSEQLMNHATIAKTLNEVLPSSRPD